MTAVDQAGKNVIRYRRRDTEQGHCVDIVVHPDRTLTEELVLAIGLSADWLPSYFATPD